MNLAQRYLKAFTPQQLADMLAQTTRENIRLKDRLNELEVENFWLTRECERQDANRHD
jgi:hypothetical protein